MRNRHAGPSAVASVLALLGGGLALGGVASAASGGPLWQQLVNLTAGIATGAAAIPVRRDRLLAGLLLAAAASWFLADLVAGTGDVHRVLLVAAAVLTGTRPGRPSAAAAARRSLAFTLPLLCLLGLHVAAASAGLVDPAIGVALDLAYAVLLPTSAAAIAWWWLRTEPDGDAEAGPATETGTRRLERALAETLGDPALTLWTPDATPARPDDLLVRMPDGSAVAVRSRTLAEDPELGDAVREAVRLGFEHQRLNDNLAATLAQIQAAGRRALAADDRQRALLATRLSAGPLRLLTSARAELPAEDQSCATARDRLELAITELRDFGDRLGPGPAPINAELATAIDDLRRGVPRSLRIETSLEPVEVDDVTARTLWFVCAEGIANVLKHAEASRASIELTSTDGGVALRITDDGIGRAADVPPGVGLTNLAERLGMIGGRLALQAVPSGGSVLLAEVPQ
ncbi:sensor histidine kinase [Propionicimonas sp.]|uniref:sensor histidine kinase n=1 Tax=Propionicimonas sp. TaxID=1955623 RepID=UPI0039E21C10